MLRDSGTYILVVGILAGILADSVVTWYEALFLVILYGVYNVLMFTQKQIKTAANKMLSSKGSFSCKYLHGNSYKNFRLTTLQGFQNILCTLINTPHAFFRKVL